MRRTYTAMVADDDDDVVDMVTMVLGSRGFRVISADSGEAARLMLCTESPDIIILDVMMDSMIDGLRLCEDIQRHPHLSQVPILLISSIEPDLGFPLDPTGLADCYLVKPLNPAWLLATVDDLIHHDINK